MSWAGRLAELRFRTSERYDLVLHDRLRPAERRRFAKLASDPEYWGVLRPRGAGTYRAIDRDTALLLLTLQEPGPLPAYVLDADRAERVAERIRAMVLDGILHAETADGEAFDERADADSAPPAIDPRSHAALHHAMALQLDNVRELAIRLYLHGAEPLTLALRDRLADRSRISHDLGLASRGAVRRRLPTGWRIETGSKTSWIFLRRHDGVEHGRGGAASGPGYKLYVGCSFEELPKVLQAVTASLGDAPARLMKVGASAIDLLRTDKLVVYFSTFESLQTFAAALSQRLESQVEARDATRHAVPFTAAADLHGRLSWGVDPPAGAVPLPGTFSDSWRSWVASRLASALVATQGAEGGADVRPEQRLHTVLERVRLDGVEVSRWTPATGLWSDVS